MQLAFLITGISIIILAIITIDITYHFAVKCPRYRSEHFKCETLGTVERLSNIVSGNVRVPLVTYSVADKKYKIAGPRFSGYVNKYVSVGAMRIGESTSNIPLTGELPAIIHTTRDRFAAQAAINARYPVGKQVPVFYDPDCPKHAFVERDAPLPKFASAILIGTSVFLIILGAAFLVLSFIFS